MLSLSQEQLDAAWRRSADRPTGQKRYQAFACEMEYELATQGIKPASIPALCVFDDRAKLLAWAQAGVPKLAKAVNTLESLGYKTDDLYAILLEMFNTWGRDWPK